MTATDMRSAIYEDLSLRGKADAVTGEPGYPEQQQVVRAERTTQDVQARDEGVSDESLIEFEGKMFRLAEAVGLVPLMRFAMASKKGVDTDDMEGLAAMYEVIRDCIYRPVLLEPEFLPLGDDQLVPNPKAGQPMEDPETGEYLCDETEWERWQRHAMNVKTDGEGINEFLTQAVQAISARPRTRRGNSSAGSPVTSEKSRADSSSPATRPEADGLVSVAALGR